MPRKTLDDYVTEINHLVDKHKMEPGSYTLNTYAHAGRQCYALNMLTTTNDVKCSIKDLVYDEMQLYLVGMINGLIRGFNDAMGNPPN